MPVRLGAPGSVARFVQETLERDPSHYGENRWLVYEYASGRDPILRAAQESRSGAESYMKPGRVLVDVKEYGGRPKEPLSSRSYTELEAPRKKTPAQLQKEIEELLTRDDAIGSGRGEPKIHEGRLELFMDAYETALRGQIAAHPEEYSYGPEAIPGVVSKMRAAFREGALKGKPSGAGWPTQGASMKQAARAVGIKPTFKALGPYLRGE